MSNGGQNSTVIDQPSTTSLVNNTANKSNTSIDEGLKNKNVFVHANKDDIKDTMRLPVEKQYNKTVFPLKLEFYDQFVFGKEIENGVFTGQINDNNIPNGYGRIEYKDGSNYIGEFLNGKPNGIGIFQRTSNFFEYGIFINGLMNGIGLRWEKKNSREIHILFVQTGMCLKKIKILVTIQPNQIQIKHF